jgi:glycosyltransferase involved in cell wall biosynthesis
MKKVILTVTNDLVYDQRMIRICRTLADGGYQVTLVGRQLSDSPKLVSQSFRQKRLRCWFSKGKAFYIEFNFRLFWWLLFKRSNLIVAIDLDTILPCYFVSVLKNTGRVYDAHELFCEMKEIVSRPVVYAYWKRIERFAVPKFKNGYTVNRPIAEEFKKLYGVDYSVIRNVPALQDIRMPVKNNRFLLYQGAVNEGRSFETLIPAMKKVNSRLVICGDGNFMDQAKQLVKENNLEDKVLFKGRILPAELKEITLNAWAGITLFDDVGLSNYYSLANRFFDYIHAGIPQLCVDFPVYRELNNQYDIAVLTRELDPDSLAAALNRLLSDEQLYKRLQENCFKARLELNWQHEEKELIAFYKKVMN